MSAQRLVAALQRVAAADADAQLDAAIDAADFHGYETGSKQRQQAQQLAQHQFGAVLAAALARCLRAVSGSTPADNSRGRALLMFAARVGQVLHQWRVSCPRASGGRARLLQEVCSTELLDVLPAACEWLTVQLMPAEQPQARACIDITAALATVLVIMYADNAADLASECDDDAADAASEALTAVSALVAAQLLQYQQQHAMAAAAAGSSTQQQRKAEAAQDRLATEFTPALVLVGICPLVCRATNGSDVPEALIAAAPELPWLAAVSLAGVAAAKHRASGGMSAMPLPGAAGASSASSSRAGRAAGSSSQGQGSPVPAFHSELLAQLGVPSMEAAFSEEKDNSLTAIMKAAHCVLQDWVPNSSNSSNMKDGSSSHSSHSSSIGGSSSSTQLSVASLQLLRSVLAELTVLDAEADMQSMGIGMFDFVSDALRNMEGRKDDAPGDEETLSLLLTMVLPAVQHAAAADSTANPATASSGAQKALQTVRTLVVLSLLQDYDYSVFDSQLFLQHPATVLTSLKAVVRLDVCNRSADGSLESSDLSELALLILHQASRSSGLCSWLQEAVSAQAAGSGRAARQAGSNCSRLLSLLVACTKGVLVMAEQGHTDGSNWLEAAYGALMTVALTSRLMDAAVEGAAGDGADAAQEQQQQLLLYGFGHLLGRSLAAAGSMIASVLPPPAAAGANTVPATATAAASAAQPSDVAEVVSLLNNITESVKEWLPGLDAPGNSQQQLLKRLEALAAAVAAVQALWGSPEVWAQAEAAAASADAGDTRAAQLCFPSVAQQLAEALVTMGGALCAALPTKHACNDPACACCDKTSEQQLVSGKGSVCSACRVARYCCVEHQHRHWKAHQPACRALAAAAAAAAAAASGGQASSSSKTRGEGSSSKRGA